MTDLSIPGVHGAALDAAAGALLLPYGLNMASLAEVLVSKTS